MRVAGILDEMTSREVPAAPSTPVNEVRLRGRLAADPVRRALPSGDELLAFRITVPRPPGSRVAVDAIDRSTMRSRVLRGLARLAPGVEVEVRGSLHRRFWRSPGGVASRYEVDVAELRRVTARRRSGA